MSLSVVEKRVKEEQDVLSSLFKEREKGREGGREGGRGGTYRRACRWQRRTSRFRCGRRMTSLSVNLATEWRATEKTRERVGATAEVLMEGGREEGSEVEEEEEEEEEEEGGRETRMEGWRVVSSSSPERRWMWERTKCTNMSATAAETAGGRDLENI